VHKLHVNVLRFMNSGRMRFFVTTGVGLAMFVPTSAAKMAAQQQFTSGGAQLQNSNTPDVNLGGGIEARLISHFGVRMDVRGHATIMPNFGSQTSSSGSTSSTTYFPVKGIATNIESTMGLVIYLF
jgi:hypothetical protein